MLEVTKEGDGVELSLELSIGGCYKELDKAAKNGEDDGDGEGNGVVVVADESEKLHDESNNGSGDDQSGSDAMDHQQRKREFHALRRQEARRKKAEKQKRSMLSKGIVNGEDRDYLEAQHFQARAQDRERRENEKIEDFPRTNNKNADTNFQDMNVCVNQAKMSNVQAQNAGCVNGFGGLFWGQGVGKVKEDEKNVNNLFQPVASRSFRPYHGSCDPGRIPSVGTDSEPNNAVKCRPGNQRPVSNGSSLERTSSAFSDYQSTSHKGGCCSTDTGSLSNYSQGCQQQLSASATSDTRERSEINGSNGQMGSEIQGNGNTANVNVKLASSNSPTPERSSDLQKPDPVENPTSTSQEPTFGTSKGSNEVVIKPPKPQTHDQGATPLPRMPLVSTTGNGPNGRTVNGFLYRYSKTEVSIVCVCHGSSFSPAGFVEHAGGVDVSHPLRHITIVPSFG